MGQSGKNIDGIVHMGGIQIDFVFIGRVDGRNKVKSGAHALLKGFVDVVDLIRHLTDGRRCV